MTWWCLQRCLINASLMRESFDFITSSWCRGFNCFIWAQSGLSCCAAESGSRLWYEFMIQHAHICPLHCPCMHCSSFISPLFLLFTPCSLFILLPPLHFTFFCHFCIFKFPPCFRSSTHVGFVLLVGHEGAWSPLVEVQQIKKWELVLFLRQIQSLKSVLKQIHTFNFKIFLFLFVTFTY